VVNARIRGYSPIGSTSPSTGLYSSEPGGTTYGLNTVTGNDVWYRSGGYINDTTNYNIGAYRSAGADSGSSVGTEVLIHVDLMVVT
jgi:hypothetical protein